MDELKFCRICLNTGVKLYHEDQCNLQLCYEQIIKVANVFPGCQNHFCYECAALLWKCEQFRKKCENGQRTLDSLQLKGPISYLSILGVNRKECSLESTLSRIIPSQKIATLNINEDGTEPCSPDVTYEITVKQEPKVQEFCETLDQNDFIDESALDDYDPTTYTESDDEFLKVHKETPEEEAEITKPLPKKRKREKILKNPKRKVRKPNTPKAKVKLIDPTSNVEEEISKEPTDKVKFAKQRAAGHKFDAEKWKIIHLTEDEMCREYRKRQYNPNYQNSLHYCEHCMRNFTCEDTLKRHMRVHNEFAAVARDGSEEAGSVNEDKGKHECFLCKRRFNWEARLRSHMKTHQIRYHCLKCPEVCVSSTSAIAHEKIHEGFVYQCKHCDMKFVKMSSYYTHVRSLHRSRHVCPTCGASFVSQFGLRQHRRAKHLEELLTPASPSLPDKTAESYCSRCDIVFKSAAAYREHENNSEMHVDDNETEVNLKVKPKLYKAGMSPATDKKHFRCDQCDEIFVSKAACEKHRGKTHGAAPDHQKRYICEICGASLAPGSIKDHKNRHAQERLFPCATCGKVFKSAPNRSRHMRTHTGEKPYACKLCDKRFTQRQNAQLHHRKYHGKAIVKRTERPT